MSYNGAGVFTINTAGQPVVTGTTISSTVFNNLTADLATGLTTALTKDGQSTPTANIKMGAFKITNLGAATLASDAARLDQIQGGGAFTFITAAGTDTITGTTSPTLTAYATGNQFSFLVANTNTGAVTINVDALGAKAITRTGTTALVAGDMVAGQAVEIIYDGTQFQLVNGNSFTNLKVSGTLAVTGVATLVAPVLGTPASVTLTNATGLPPAGVVGTAAILAANTFTAAQTLPAAGAILTGSTSGTTTLVAAAAASGTATLPAAGGTLAVLATNTFTGAQIGTVTALTSTSAAMAINLATNNNFSYTTAENSTLSAPSNPVAGQSGVITITQGATARTLAYNTFWKFAGGTVPTLTATASAVDMFAYQVESATRATAQLIKDVK